MYSIADRFERFEKSDTLKSPGGSICWYSLNVRSQYTGDVACYCKHDLCNMEIRTRSGGSSGLVMIIILIIIIIIVLCVAGYFIHNVKS